MKSVVLYDAECGLCSGLVRWLKSKDHLKQLHWLSIISPEGLIEKKNFSIDVNYKESLLYVKNGSLYVGGSAVLTILHDMGGAWKILAHILSFLPKVIIDWGYSHVARYRYGFKRSENTCSNEISTQV